ncbi:hypothetical protein BGX31_008585 [Mortierella sp. GBA43]|nr:hypothetical protein BGX31_008585 [Mortierella sp. GBA43]
MAQHHHALDLPEIIFQIGRHLELLEDVVACSLVCKRFHAFLEPYVWMSVHIGRLAPRDRRRLRRQEPLARLINLKALHGNMHPKEPGHTERQDRILQGLQRMAPWIRNLSIRGHYLPSQLALVDRCAGINTLHIAGVPRRDLFNETYWNDCEALLRQNSACLRSLTLVRWDIHDHCPVQPIWRPLLACAQHTNLSTLRIRKSRISEHGLQVIWGICQLEILELRSLDMEDESTRLSGPSATGTMMSHSHNGEQVATSAPHTLTHGASTNWSTPTIATTTVRFPKLRELTLARLSIESEYQLEQFIIHCPLLQTLSWSAMHSQPCWQQFCGYFAASTWSHLDWIEIKNERTLISDQDHALLLQSAPRPLRRLEVDIGTLEQTTFNIYRERGHFATLTKVDLTHSVFTLPAWSSTSSALSLISKQVQEVLESCPMLEHIIALVIFARDIIQGKPWVCRQLRIFKVMINMEPSGGICSQEGKQTGIKYSKDQRIQCHQIFERLGQLRQLTVLNMRLYDENLYFDSDTNFTSLPWRLEMGLGYLSTLRKLESIGHHGSQEIRVVDMEWMLQHWKNLRTITGGRFSLKCCKTLEGAPDDRLVMETLKARHGQQNPVWLLIGEELEIVYCSESESESEVDDGAK